MIIASDNINVWDVIRENACKYFKEENIYDVFNKVCVEREVRIETLRINALRIKEKNIEECVAELGVYKGDFAKEINRYFNDRNLYLFDTFEGFLHEKTKTITENRVMAKLQANPEANMHVVEDFSLFLSQFPYPEKCIVRKGFFPETSIGVDEKYAFVSLDVDIYETTKEGLNYFYPRMSKNGIIMIHDYTSWTTTGVKKAVDEFCNANNCSVVLISDVDGSAILMK